MHSCSDAVFFKGNFSYHVRKTAGTLNVKDKRLLYAQQKFSWRNRSSGALLLLSMLLGKNGDPRGKDVTG